MRASGDPFYILGVLLGMVEWNVGSRGRRSESGQGA